ncbi:MAG: 3-methyl-2-oxobutanoate hydroxymethyltransferase [Acidimicrobiales bacterium]
MSERPTIPQIRQHKRAAGAPPLVMVTAYDAPSARVADDAGVELILVGDSLAMVVLGYENTLQVTIDDIAHHTAAVHRAGPGAVVVGDMPWMSYHNTVPEAVDNAAKLIRAGAQAVKLEGGRKRLPVVRALLDAEIPVMGHIGLTPQSVHAMGGFKVQGRELNAVRELLDDAKALADEGCFSIVVEGVPTLVGELLTEAVPVPTIGIGAGAGCDGQVLVFHDLLGWYDRKVPKFVRRYADLRGAALDALCAYRDDVRSGAFPSEAESYGLKPEAAAELARAFGR